MNCFVYIAAAALLLASKPSIQATQALVNTITTTLTEHKTRSKHFYAEGTTTGGGVG